MIERGFLLFFCSAVLNIVLTVCLIFTCNNSKALDSDIKIASTNVIYQVTTLEDLLRIRSFSDFTKQISLAEDNELQRQEAGIASAPAIQTPQVSYTASSAARLSSGLAGIRGRVNTGEINPINYDNPDINVLKQMGAEQYLIHYFTGEQFFKSGDLDKAIAEYTTAINIYPEFAEAFISRGNIRLKRKDYSQAIEDFTRAIRLDSGRAEIFNYRGFARSERGEHAQAIEDYSRAISINPNYVDALINRSYSYYQLGDYDRVIEDCTRIINLEPNNAFIWNRRGSAFYNIEDDDKAINDFTEAIRLRRNYAVAYQNRGNAWQSKGDTEKANADFAVARSLR